MTSLKAGRRIDDTQIEMSDKGFVIAVVLQQFKAVFDAKSRYHTVDRIAYRESRTAQNSKIGCGGYRNSSVRSYKDGEIQQVFLDSPKAFVAANPLKNFAENEREQADFLFAQRFF